MIDLPEFRLEVFFSDWEFYAKHNMRSPTPRR